MGESILIKPSTKVEKPDYEVLRDFSEIFEQVFYDNICEWLLVDEQHSLSHFNNSKAKTYMGQSTQKMGQVNLWKIVFKKFEDRQFE